MLVKINVQKLYYLYWGFCKKVSGWFRQPPALFSLSSPLIQDPLCWDSLQVLANENTEVLISLQIDNSVKLLKKSSNGILQTKAELITLIFNSWCIHFTKILRHPWQLIRVCLFLCLESGSILEIWKAFGVESWLKNWNYCCWILHNHYMKNNSWVATM